LKAPIPAQVSDSGERTQRNVHGMPRRKPWPLQVRDARTASAWRPPRAFPAPAPSWQ
jgi:hypothetical protein